MPVEKPDFTKKVTKIKEGDKFKTSQLPANSPLRQVLEQVQKTKKPATATKKPA